MYRYRSFQYCQAILLISMPVQSLPRFPNRLCLGHGINSRDLYAPIGSRGQDVKPRKKGYIETITDLLSAELALLPFMEGIRSQLGDKIVLEQCGVAERTLDLDSGCLYLVFVLVVST